MKKSRKILLTAVAFVLVIALTIMGTIAYLTDRDSEVNVFTVGDVRIDLTEDFEQGSELIPNVKIEKTPKITNTGKNDAWVWLTFSIPSALDEWAPGTDVGSSENVIHWNPLGATIKGRVSETYINNAINLGYLPQGTTVADIEGNNTTWDVFNTMINGGNCYRETINNVEYNTYVIPYNKALQPGESTLPGIYRVYLDARVDISPEGDWYFVENGQTKKLDWNSNTDGNPRIYASAYAIQATGFNDVYEAYAAYGKQWGDNGSEYATNPTVNVSTTDQMDKALQIGGVVNLEADVSDDNYKVNENIKVELNLNSNEMDGTILNDGELNASSGTIKSDKAGIENTGVATFTDVTVEAGSAGNYATIHREDSVTTYNDVDIVSAGGGVGAAAGSKVVFNGNKVEVNSPSTSGRYNFYAEGQNTEITINDGTFSFSSTLNQKRAYIYAGAGTTVYVNGGTFGKASTRSGYTAGILTSGDGKVIIKGGTFGFNPSTWVAEGYQATKTGDVWIVSAI